MDHASRQRESGPFDVVALIASAGGHEAISTIVEHLPARFPLGLVIVQHLGLQSTRVVDLLDSWVPFPVRWAEDGAPVAPGQVLVCPPRTFLELLPDGTCALAPCERGALDYPLTHFLDSVARSYGPRAIAVVLSGMGDDGAVGAQHLHEAGGCVLVQDAHTAAFAAMPLAAVQAGAADLVLPVEQIAAVVVALAAGRPVPRPPTEREAVDALFAVPGHASAALRAVDWRTTSLGPVRTWPQALRTLVRTLLGSPFPSCLYWGPEFVQLYNEAFLPLVGAKPAPAGRPARHTWPERWQEMGAQFAAVLASGAGDLR